MKKDKDKKRAEDRFGWKADSVKITFIPQCNLCTFNQGGTKCEIYGTKPKEYTSDELTCPDYEGPPRIPDRAPAWKEPKGKKGKR